MAGVSPSSPGGGGSPSSKTTLGEGLAYNLYLSIRSNCYREKQSGTNQFGCAGRINSTRFSRINF